MELSLWRQSVCVFLGVTLDSKLTFDTHLHEVMSKAAKSLGAVRRAGKVDCLLVLKSCFNAYVLSNLEYCALVQISSTESHLTLLDSVVRSAETLYEDGLCCLGHKKKVSALRLIYDIYHRVYNPLNGYLNHFVAARNARASAALSELALVIPCCRTEQFSRLCLTAAVRLWNLLPSGVFSGDIFSSFKSVSNLCLLMAQLDFFYLFQSLIAILLLAWHKGSGPLVYRCISFSSSMYHVILIIDSNSYCLVIAIKRQILLCFSCELEDISFFQL